MANSSKRAYPWARRGHLLEAMDQYVQALQIDPHFTDARDSLAKLQALQYAPAKKKAIPH